MLGKHLESLRISVDSKILPWLGAGSHDDTTSLLSLTLTYSTKNNPVKIFT